MNYGREECKERQKLLEIPLRDCQRKDIYFLESSNTTFNIFFRALQLFGGFLRLIEKKPRFVS